MQLPQKLTHNMQTFLYFIIAIASIGMLFLIIKHAKNQKKEVFLLDFKPFTQTAGVNLELLRLINDHRINKAIQPVREELHLHEEAVNHAIYMQGQKKASHDNALARRKYFLNNGFKTYGEITSFGYTKPESLFKAYLKSENHKKIIENPSYNCVGIYTCFDGGKMYNCVVFGGS